MAFTGRSNRPGKRACWLEAASDIRFVDLEGKDETVLHFEAPSFGEAAEEHYLQMELWPSKPPAGYTGFETLAAVFTDVGSHNLDSETFDLGLLKRLCRFEKLLAKTFDELALGELACAAPAILRAETVDLAKQMTIETPRPRRVRVAGMLDMVRASTQAFELVLDDGQRVRGILLEGDIVEKSDLMRQRVMIHGRAIYRPSGRPLRLDAEIIEASESAPTFWSRIPPSLGKRLDIKEYRELQSAKSGVAAFFGTWPGNESDEEVFSALEEMS